MTTGTFQWEYKFTLPEWVGGEGWIGLAAQLTRDYGRFGWELVQVDVHHTLINTTPATQVIAFFKRQRFVASVAESPAPRRGRRSTP